MTTTAQRKRTELRTKLYTGCMIPGSHGRGGDAIEEGSTDVTRPGLVQMWPTYLDLERRAAKNRLTMLGVAHMLDKQKTPAFNTLPPRPLSENEVRVIQAWYDAAVKVEKEELGEALAQAQGNIMGQAAANHEEAMEQLRQQKEQMRIQGEQMQQLREIAANPKKLRKIDKPAWLPAEEGEVTGHYWPANAPAPRAVDTETAVPEGGRYYHKVVIERFDASGDYLFRYCGQDRWGKKPWEAFRLPSSKDCKVQVTTDIEKLPGTLRRKMGLKGIVRNEPAAAANSPQREDVLTVELAGDATKRFKIKRKLLTFLAADDAMEPSEPTVEGEPPYEKKRLQALRQLCRERELATGGKKVELVARLRAKDSAEPAGEEQDEDATEMTDAETYRGGRDEAGLMHGMGCLETSIEKYIGQFLPRRHGRGKLVSAATTYIGEFADNLLHGMGVLTGTDGTRYEGEFHMGRRAGKGVTTFPDGCATTGDVDCEGTGYAIREWKGGDSEVGQWIAKKLYIGLWVPTAGFVEAGTFDDKAELHGWGKQHRESSTVQGFFQHGRLHGIYQEKCDEQVVWKAPAQDMDEDF